MGVPQQPPQGWPDQAYGAPTLPPPPTWQQGGQWAAPGYPQPAYPQPNYAYAYAQPRRPVGRKILSVLGIVALVVAYVAIRVVAWGGTNALVGGPELGANVEAADVTTRDLVAGNCFLGQPLWSGTVHRVDCGDDHDWFVASWALLNEATYPGTKAIEDELNQYCEAGNTRVYPSAAEYVPGDHALCLNPA